jgi:hypothetical protein
MRRIKKGGEEEEGEGEERKSRKTRRTGLGEE